MNAGGMAALEICDLPPVVGSSWIDFWQGNDQENARKAVAAARAGGIGRFVGFFATTQTKTPKWWDVIVSPILDANGNPCKAPSGAAWWRMSLLRSLRIFRRTSYKDAAPMALRHGAKINILKGLRHSAQRCHDPGGAMLGGGSQAR
jgi:hypothetical protein